MYAIVDVQNDKIHVTSKSFQIIEILKEAYTTKRFTVRYIPVSSGFKL